VAKQSGLGDRLLVGGRNASGDIGSIQRVAGGPSPLGVTGIDKSAFERIGGKRDGGIDFTAFFIPDSEASHELLSALPTADVVVSYLRGTTLGGPAACEVAKQADYPGTRGEDGSLTFQIATMSNSYGVAWGEQHTAGLRTDTSATSGASVDASAASAFGLAAFLQVDDFAGTDVTVKLQQSSDNGVGDAWADVVGGAFTAVTASPTGQRIQTALDQAVERYLRVVTTTSGGFTTVSFSVVVVRHITEVKY
jgi:hypothetical protein